jgi:hypothetical protein
MRVVDTVVAAIQNNGRITDILPGLIAIFSDARE